VRSLIGALARTAPGAKPAVPYTTAAATPTLLTGLGGARLTLLNAYGANGTLYATVSRFANATSQVQWRLWRKAKSGKPEDRTQVTSHLALDVWAMPNQFTPRQLFVESFQQHLDLVGEGWWVINRNVFGWPESMWIVRPDRIAPVPSVENGIAGYVYHGPNGQQIPLDAGDVIRLLHPNPADPGPAGRGLGAAQTILAQVESVAFSAQWNRNFFANSAIPGGIITVPTTLSDDNFNRLRMQWAEQHRGVAAAHRVGILEGGASWNDGPAHKDMEFTQLLNTSRDVIREAFAMPKFMLGMVDDVNRATADASSAAFGTWGLVPRLERIKQALNTQFLPMFGPAGHGTGQPDVEFDYDDPVPPDAEGSNNELMTKVNAYVALVGAGVSPVDAAAATGMPEMNHVAAPAPQPAPAGEPTHA
jgi:phage portal protein BeeE